jgi:hypothetical protein
LLVVLLRCAPCKAALSAEHKAISFGVVLGI